MKDNLTLIDVAPNPLVGIVEDLKRNLETHKEFKKLDAELKKTHYDALIEQGFTEQQALYLVKS